VQNHQRRFLDLALARDALRFGEFTLKSGRVSPYFFNAGRLDSGAALAEIGECYAHALDDAGLEFDMLFGPAYKGIPLAASIAIALAGMGRNVPFAYNRKEAKDHGEGGTVVGAKLQGRVLIVDDVISAGTSVGESMQLIRAAGATAVGVMISLDRQERGQGQHSAAQEVELQHGIPVGSIVGLDDIVSYLQSVGGHTTELAAIAAYRRTWGV